MAKDILHELQNVYSLKSRKSKIILIILCFFTGIFSGLIVSSYTLLLNKISFFKMLDILKNNLVNDFKSMIELIDKTKK